MIHQPGRGWRFALPGETNASDGGSTALVLMSEADKALAATFESEGGTALCLSSGFKGADRLQNAADKMLQAMEDRNTQEADLVVLEKAAAAELEAAGLSDAAQMLKGSSLRDQATLVLKAAAAVEEKHAVSRNVWSDIEFHAGDKGNA